MENREKLIEAVAVARKRVMEAKTMRERVVAARELGNAEFDLKIAMGETPRGPIDDLSDVV